MSYVPTTLSSKIIKDQFSEARALLDQVHQLIDSGTPGEVAKASSILKSILPLYKEITNNEDSKTPENIEQLKEIKVRLTEETNRVVQKRDEAKRASNPNGMMGGADLSQSLDLSQSQQQQRSFAKPELPQKPSLLQGYLKKLGEKGIVKSYKKRWFQQKDHKLYYYEKEGDTQSYGFINLPDMLAVKTIDSGFELATPGRIYNFQVLKASDLNYWTEGLKEFKKYYTALQASLKQSASNSMSDLPSNQMSLGDLRRMSTVVPPSSQQQDNSGSLRDLRRLSMIDGNASTSANNITYNHSNNNESTIKKNEEEDAERQRREQIEEQERKYREEALLEQKKKEQDEIQKRQEEEERLKMIREEERLKKEKELENIRMKERERIKELHEKQQREKKEEEDQRQKRVVDEMNEKIARQQKEQDEQIEKRKSISLNSTPVVSSPSYSSTSSPAVSSPQYPPTLSSATPQYIDSPSFQSTTPTIINDYGGYSNNSSSNSSIDEAVLRRQIEEEVSKRLMKQHDELMEIERQRRLSLENEVQKLKDQVAQHVQNEKSNANVRLDLQLRDEEIDRLKKDLVSSETKITTLQKENEELSKPSESFPAEFAWAEEIATREKTIVTLREQIVELTASLKLKENAVSVIKRENEMLREETEKKDKYINTLSDRNRDSIGTPTKSNGANNRPGSVDINKLRESMLAHQSQNGFLLSEINRLETENELFKEIKGEEISELTRSLNECIYQYQTLREKLIGASQAEYCKKIEKENIDIKKEYFLSLAVSVKLHRGMAGETTNINIHNLYDETIKANVDYKHWPEWISSVIEDKKNNRPNNTTFESTQRNRKNSKSLK